MNKKGGRFHTAKPAPFLFFRINGEFLIFARPSKQQPGGFVCFGFTHVCFNLTK